MVTGDTIIAVATGAGPSARALVRASGPGVVGICARLLPGVTARRWAGAARLALGSHELPVLAARYIGPASYTGEDALEILMVGNPTLVARVMDALRAAGDTEGVRDAQPGEFSARAYLHGKLSLAQAEGVSAVIAASSSAQLRAARAVLSGESGTLYTRWADEIATLLALVEAGIDFTDQEDVVPIAPAALLARATVLIDEMAHHAGARAGREAPTGRVRVALAGAPNAGKSTLFNALLGRSRAVVSPTAGTTRDALVEPLTLCEDARGTITVDLIDLAGLDEGLAQGGTIDAEAQRRAHAELEQAGVVVWCVPDGKPEGSLLRADAAKVLHVRTKADRAVGKHDQLGCLRVCALDGRGLDDLRRAIYDAAWVVGTSGADPSMCLPRHAAAIVECVGVLQGVRTTIAAAAASRALGSPEVLAGQLRDALDALSVITGRVERDEIIGRIFATFCIGK